MSVAGAAAERMRKHLVDVHGYKRADVEHLSLLAMSLVHIDIDHRGIDYDVEVQS